MRTCIINRRSGKPQSYTVYDAQGLVVIITTSKTLAERLTHERK